MPESSLNPRQEPQPDPKQRAGLEEDRPGRRVLHWLIGPWRDRKTSRWFLAVEWMSHAYGAYALCVLLVSGFLWVHSQRASKDSIIEALNARIELLETDLRSREFHLQQLRHQIDEAGRLGGQHTGDLDRRVAQLEQAVEATLGASSKRPAPNSSMMPPY